MCRSFAWCCELVLLLALQGPTEAVASTTWSKLRRNSLPEAEGPQLATLERPLATVFPGQAVKLYFVGSSNLIYMTWIDHLHVLLRRLGFSLSTSPGKLAFQPTLTPGASPVCDDAAQYSKLLTYRTGDRAGWASWNFAYDDRSDCDATGFRTIAGHRVSCLNGWGCTNESMVRPSDIAQEADGSHAVVLSVWMNDRNQEWTGYVCFGGVSISLLETVKISVASLQRIIRKIHSVDPNILVIVLATYPLSNTLEGYNMTVNTSLLSTVNAMNAAVANALQDEPRTVFANFTIPADEEMFQKLHIGHPNCRGDKIIATAVLQTLYDQGVLSRGLALDNACLNRGDCSTLEKPCCQSSAVCRVDLNGTCIAFTSGAQ